MWRLISLCQKLPISVALGFDKFLKNWQSENSWCISWDKYKTNLSQNISSHTHVGVVRKGYLKSKKKSSKQQKEVVETWPVPKWILQWCFWQKLPVPHWPGPPTSEDDQQWWPRQKRTPLLRQREYRHIYHSDWRESKSQESAHWRKFSWLSNNFGIVLSQKQLECSVNTDSQNISLHREPLSLPWRFRVLLKA